MPAAPSAPGASMYQGGTPAAAAPAPAGMDLSSLYNDPTIMAFLRSSGLGEQVAANEVARRQAAIQQALGTNIEDLGAQGEIARRNIAGSQEASGVFRSGQTLQRTAEQEQQQARTQGALQQQATNQLNDLQGNLAMQVAQNQQKAAELGTQQYVKNALASGKAGIDAQYGGNDQGSGASTDEEDTGY